MKWQFKIEIEAHVPIDARDRDHAEEQANELIDELIAETPFAEESPTSDFMLQERHGARYVFLFRYWDVKYGVEGSLESAKLEVHDAAIKELLAGSKLIEREIPFVLTTVLSATQDELDEIFSWIEDNDRFAVQEPGARYHYACGVHAFGQKRVNRAEQGKDDELTVIFGREWYDTVYNALANEEEVIAYCDGCRQSLYDDPPKFDDSEEETEEDETDGEETDPIAAVKTALGIPLDRDVAFFPSLFPSEGDIDN